jgi:hypothetical protein
VTRSAEIPQSRYFADALPALGRANVLDWPTGAVRVTEHSRASTCRYSSGRRRRRFDVLVEPEDVLRVGRGYLSAESIALICNEELEMPIPQEMGEGVAELQAA